MKAGRDVNRCKFLSICLFRDGNNLVLVESIEIQKLNFPNLTSKNFVTLINLFIFTVLILRESFLM